MAKGNRMATILLAISATALMAQTAGNAGPRPNDIFLAKDGTKVAGWAYSGGALWGKKAENCCVSFFSRGDDVMLVLTERVGADKNLERVRRTFRLPHVKDAVVSADCVMDRREMLLAVLDRKSGRVTGYETDGSGFQALVRPLHSVQDSCDFSYQDE